MDICMCRVAVSILQVVSNLSARVYLQQPFVLPDPPSPRLSLTIECNEHHRSSNSEYRYIDMAIMF
jgi:hypothetical protein